MTDAKTKLDCREPSSTPSAALKGLGEALQLYTKAEAEEGDP